MSVEINVSPYLSTFTNNAEVVEVNGNTVSECLKHLVEKFPRVGQQLFAKNGELFKYIIIAINGENAYPEPLNRQIRDSDKLDIIFIISGG